MVGARNPSSNALQSGQEEIKVDNIQYNGAYEEE